MTNSGTKLVFDRYRSAGFGDTAPATIDEAYGPFLPFLGEDRDAPILDLGCGGGEFLEYLGRHGYRCLSGIDYSDEQVARCGARGLRGVERVTDSRIYLDTRPAAFASIVMNDVIEHIPKSEIVPTLVAIRRALAPGGVLIAKTPNAASAFGMSARYLDFTHEISFTEHSLRQVIVAAGFKEVSVRGLPVPFQLRPRRVVFWTMNRLYKLAHRVVYVAAAGSDAPKVLDKLLLATARG